MDHDQLSKKFDRVIETLLPGDGAGWPSAALLDLSSSIEVELRSTEAGCAALDAVLDALPAGFRASDQAAREAMLAIIERIHPDDFERVISAAYLAYYTAPAVRQVIEHRTGYAARPPQPLGYALEPFDEHSLDRQKAREPFWRKA